MENKVRRWGVLLIVVAIMFITAHAAAFFLNDVAIPLGGDNIVVVPIYGPILTDQADNGLFDTRKVIADNVIKELKDAEENPNVKAVILEINSPGGAALPSAEIAEQVKRMNKTTYAVIRDVGASGAYWIASAADTVVASPMSITGSIGVISSYLEFSDLFDKYGVEYERLVAGELKDMGSPFKDLTEEERAILEIKLEKIHTMFSEAVQENRQLSDEELARVNTGEFFLGIESVELGLVDALASKEEAIKMLESELNITDAHLIEKKHEESILDLFTKQLGASMGQGFASAIVERGQDSRLSLDARI